MAIPFSNTNYRIPRGFASLLEGLTREVLREQPKDIPLFASKYFSDLLQNREGMGFDPAEWSASLEDRFYNNHSFQHAEENIFTPRSEGVSSFRESAKIVDSSMEFPQPLDVPLEEEHKAQPQEVTSEEEHIIEQKDVPSEEESKIEQQDVPSEEDHKIEKKHVPSEEEHKTEQHNVSSEEDHKIEQQEVPSEEDHKIEQQDVPLEEDHKIEQQEVPSEEDQEIEKHDVPSEEDHKIEQQDVPSKEEQQVQAQEVPSEGEEQKIQLQDVSSSIHRSEEVVYKEDEGPGRDQAATVIQAAIRGHLVRQEVKKLQEVETGDKPNIGPSSSGMNSATQDEEQETDRTDFDSAEHMELPLVGSTAAIQDISKPGVSDEDPSSAEANITDVSGDRSVAEAFTSDTALQEHQHSGQEDGLQVDTPDEKDKVVDNKGNNAGMTDDDGVQAADKGDEIDPEDPESEATEPPSSGKETVTGMEKQESNQEQDEEPETLTVASDQNLVEDINDQLHETTENRKDEAAEQSIIEDRSEQTAMVTGQNDVVDTAEHVAQTTGHSKTEETSDQTSETTNQPAIDDSGEQTTVTEETEEKKTENNGDQPASGTVLDEERAGEENESCMKHQDEALDIALDDPGANAAATKIQAGFRGHMTRKKMKGSEKELQHKDGKEGSSAEGSIES